MCKKNKWFSVPIEVKRIEKYYSIKGDGVAQLNLVEALKSRRFKKTLKNLKKQKIRV